MTAIFFMALTGAIVGAFLVGTFRKSAIIGCLFTGATVVVFGLVLFGLGKWVGESDWMGVLYVISGLGPMLGVFFLFALKAGKSEVNELDHYKYQ